MQLTTHATIQHAPILIVIDWRLPPAWKDPTTLPLPRRLDVWDHAALKVYPAQMDAHKSTIMLFASNKLEDKTLQNFLRSILNFLKLKKMIPVMAAAKTVKIDIIIRALTKWMCVGTTEFGTYKGPILTQFPLIVLEVVITDEEAQIRHKPKSYKGLTVNKRKLATF